VVAVGAVSGEGNGRFHLSSLFHKDAQFVGLRANVYEEFGRRPFVVGVQTILQAAQPFVETRLLQAAEPYS
jgi:hypothetical protein